MKVTRRKLAAAVIAPSAASLAQAQRTVPAADEELAAARERMRANSQSLGRENVPMPTEPAFQFKA